MCVCVCERERERERERVYVGCVLWGRGVARVTAVLEVTGELRCGVEVGIKGCENV